MTEPRDAPAFKSSDALEIVSGFCVVLKTAKFYEPNNANFIEQLNVLLATLSRSLQFRDEIHLQVSRSTIYVNHLRVKFDFGTYHIYKSVLTELQAKGIGVLAFLQGIAADELSRFLVLLSRLEAKGEDSFERLDERVSVQDFPHIVLKKEYRSELPGERENRAVRMYFMGISHAKELFEKQRGVLKFNVTTRWIQSIFDYIILDESFLYGLTNIKNHDEYTLNHSVNVAILTLGLGRRLGLSRSELAELGLSAFLHDLGKLDIPVEILEKPTQLDREERTVMDRHSHRGAERIIELKVKHGIPNRAVQVAFEHHLKADLSGYSIFGRKKRLNLYSKIVKITDSYDALTTKRVYRPKAFTQKEALEMMLHQSGGEFDPLLLKAFAVMIGPYPVGSLVALDTGEIGIVFELSSHRGLAQRPKVKLITDPQGNKIDGVIMDLAENDAATRSFKRTIVKYLDPEKYGIRVSDYFLAQTPRP